jgi:hypothetical protein
LSQYGFRPGRSPHDALDALATGIKRRKVSWVLDADISDFFGSLDRGWLEKFLEHRIADPRVLRLIQKSLSAGVMRARARSGMPEACQPHDPITTMNGTSAPRVLKLNGAQHTVAEQDRRSAVLEIGIRLNDVPTLGKGLTDERA